MVLRVGTDCSGMEAPIMALRMLGIPFVHEFSSEIDRFCIETILANYRPKIIYGDITTRDPYLLPDIDLYVCGFPCQPFSAAGNQAGFSDPRGTIFWSCMGVITVKQPRYFVLENVKGLVWHDDGKTWKIVTHELNKLKQFGYNLYCKVLNTRDYGVPQNRERVFIVGTKDTFEWPDKIPMDDISTYVDWNDRSRSIINTKRMKDVDNLDPKYYFIDLGFIKKRKGYYPNADRYSSTLLAQGEMWCVPMTRRANARELLMLQGFNPNSFNVVVSFTQISKQLGNTMSVNVLMAIFSNLLH